MKVLSYHFCGLGEMCISDVLEARRPHHLFSPMRQALLECDPEDLVIMPAKLGTTKNTAVRSLQGW